MSSARPFDWRFGWGAFLLLTLGIARLPAATLVFDEPDFEWHRTGGIATPHHIWSQGDFWAQNFLATGLDSANNMSLSLLFDSDPNPAGQPLDLGVFLNSQSVGNFSVLSGVAGLQTYTFAFPGISGADYRIEIRAGNTLPEGSGAVSIALNGASFATLVPEPSSTALLGIGALIVCGYVALRLLAVTRRASRPRTTPAHTGDP